MTSTCARDGGRGLGERGQSWEENPREVERKEEITVKRMGAGLPINGRMNGLNEWDGKGVV